MKIRTDFVTNSSSSSFVTFELHDSEFCRFVWNKMQELYIPYEGKTHYLSEFDFNENSLSGEICIRTLYEEEMIDDETELFYWEEDDSERELDSDYIADNMKDIIGVDSVIFSIADHLDEKAKSDFYHILFDTLKADHYFDDSDNWNEMKDKPDFEDTLYDDFSDYIDLGNFNVFKIEQDIQIEISDKFFGERLFNFLKTVQLDEAFSFSGDCFYFKKDDKTLEIHSDCVLLIFNTKKFKYLADTKHDKDEIYENFLRIMHYFLPLAHIAEDEELQELLDCDEFDDKLNIRFYMGYTD